MTDVSEMADTVDALFSALRRQDSQIAIAESCTGGLLAGTITETAGASDVFGLGVVSYSNAAKIDMLDVSPETIDTAGAVSEATAREMARGITNQSGARYGVAITGIAGPTGERPGKPVGTVYIAIADIDREENKIDTQRYHFDGDRSSIRHQSIRAALNQARASIDTNQGSNRPA